jgi:hypothetical protein
MKRRFVDRKLNGLSFRRKFNRARDLDSQIPEVRSGDTGKSNARIFHIDEFSGAEAI